MSHYSFSKGNPSLTEVSCSEKRVKQLSGSVQFRFKIISVQPFSFITKNIDWFGLKKKKLIVVSGAVITFLLPFFLVSHNKPYWLDYKSFGILPKQYESTHMVQVNCSLSLYLYHSCQHTQPFFLFLQLQIWIFLTVFLATIST